MEQQLKGKCVRYKATGHCACNSTALNELSVSSDGEILFAV